MGSISAVGEKKYWYPNMPYLASFAGMTLNKSAVLRIGKKKSRKKEICKNFFSSRVISPCKVLQEQVVTAPTLNTFKNHQDKFIGDKQFTLFPDN